MATKRTLNIPVAFFTLQRYWLERIVYLKILVPTTLLVENPALGRIDFQTVINRFDTIGFVGKYDQRVVGFNDRRAIWREVFIVSFYHSNNSRSRKRQINDFFSDRISIRADPDFFHRGFGML